MSAIPASARTRRPWGCYSDLRPVEIEAILAESPIAYIPWGALEWHSLHAPVGLDSVKAEGICKVLAKMSGGVVLPVIPMGVNTIKPFKGFPHSIDISSALATEVAREFCLQLADEGFRAVILFTGHYPPEQIDALQAGADAAAAIARDTRFEVWADLMFLSDPYQPDHAGATETSFQIYFSPDSVQLADLPERDLTLDVDGITGEDPRAASASRGKAQLEMLMRNAAPRLDRLLEELGLAT